MATALAQPFIFQPLTAPASPEVHLVELEHALRAQAEAQEALVTLLDEERTALTYLKTEEIHRCAEQKVAAATAAQECTAACERAASDVAAALFGAKTGGQRIRLGQIIEQMPESAARVRLAGLRERLLAAATRVADGQRRNEMLTANFMNTLGRSMEAVQQAVARLATYTPTAKVEQAKWRGCVLRQTA